MWNWMLPEKAGNDYRGKPIARWILLLITILSIARSLVHVIAQDGGAQSIATIPLDQFTIGGADTVVLLFGYWGISQLLMTAIFLIVLLRYRALISLMYLFLIGEYLLRFILGRMKPIETVHTAPGAVGNMAMIPLALGMFFLSLPSREEDTHQDG